MTEFTYDLFLLWLLPKLLSLAGASFDYIVKFAIYYLYYKNILVGNLTRTFVCIANYLYFLYSWNNLSMAFFFAHNTGAYTVEPDLVTKKGESPKTRLYLIFCFFQPPSFLSLILSEMHLVISECLAISKQQLKLTLASFFLLAYIISGKLTQ